MIEGRMIFTFSNDSYNLIDNKTLLNVLNAQKLNSKEIFLLMNYNRCNNIYIYLTVENSDRLK